MNVVGRNFVSHAYKTNHNDVCCYKPEHFKLLISFNKEKKIESSLVSNNIFLFFYSEKQKLHEHTQMKRKMLRHGQRTNTQKTEQNNTYQPKPPQGTK